MKIFKEALTNDVRPRCVKLKKFYEEKYNVEFTYDEVKEMAELSIRMGSEDKGTICCHFFNKKGYKTYEPCIRNVSNILISKPEWDKRKGELKSMSENWRLVIEELDN